MKDRELDFLIAEKVMGWIEDKNAYSPDKVKSYIRQDRLQTYTPFFSTDLKEAWAVVERFAGTPWKFHLDQEGDVNETLWRATFEHSNPGQSLTVQAKTPSEAICLAALKTV